MRDAWREGPREYVVPAWPLLGGFTLVKFLDNTDERGEGEGEAGKNAARREQVEATSMDTLPLRDSRRQCQIVDHGLPRRRFLRCSSREHLVYHARGVGVSRIIPSFLSRRES